MMDHAHETICEECGKPIDEEEAEYAYRKLSPARKDGDVLEWSYKRLCPECTAKLDPDQNERSMIVAVDAEYPCPNNGGGR